MIRTQGLTHVHLIVADLDRSLAFYARVFGMVEQFRDGPAMVFLQTPGSSDLITLNEQPGDPRIGHGGVDHIGFRLVDKNDLDDAIRQVVEAGGRLVCREALVRGRVQVAALGGATRNPPCQFDAQRTLT